MTSKELKIKWTTTRGITTGEQLSEQQVNKKEVGDKQIIKNYYMANLVLGKSLSSDWFFLGQDFAVLTVSMETVQSVYFCFGAKPTNSKFATKTAKKKCE